MPLTGNPKKDIHEMAHSAGHKKRVGKHGKKIAHKMEVAAALREEGKKSKRGDKKMSKRGSRRA